MSREACAIKEALLRAATPINGQPQLAVTAVRRVMSDLDVSLSEVQAVMFPLLADHELSVGPGLTFLVGDPRVKDEAPSV